MSKNVYDMVTERIIAELESGLIPWQKPWTGTHSGAFNRISKKPYSLINQFLLKNEGEYATMKQWNELGGKIKKGSKAEFVVFWKMHQVEEPKEDGTKVTKTIPLLRYYNVFHISNVEGVEPLNLDSLKPLEPIAEAEAVKEAYKTKEHITIDEIVTNDAFYSPSRDFIQVPCREQYQHIEEFYSTLFHEMIHSTGHKNRLDRLTSGINSHFGGTDYSKEELTAEIGSAYILNRLGIETSKTFRNSSAYIQNWLQVLKNDNKFIISASSKAEKAVEYIMG